MGDVLREGSYDEEKIVDEPIAVQLQSLGKELKETT